MQKKVSALMEIGLILFLLTAGCRHPEFTGIPINNKLLAAADQNRDGMVDREEMSKLVMTLKTGLMNPHNFRIAVLEPADTNHDGFLDEKELDNMRNLFCYRLMPRLFETNREFARKFDRNNNNRIDQPESEAVKALLFSKEGPGRPRPVREELDKIMDLNHNNFVDEREIETIIKTIYLELVKIPFDLDRMLEQSGGDEAAADRNRGNESQRIPRTEPVDTVLDLNNDGYIDETEFNQIRRIFDNMEKRPHKTRDADRRIDLNMDGRIVLEEIKTVGNRIKNVYNLFMQTGENRENGKTAENLLEELADTNNDHFLDPEELKNMDKTLSEPGIVRSEFGRRIDFNGNNEVEPFEIEKALRARDVPLNGNQAQMPEKVRGRTPIDGIFDLDGDGNISREEVAEAVAFFIRGEGKIDPGFKPARIFDLNKDNFFSRNEMRFILDNFLRPHPANDKFDIDKQSDKNHNGFIEPDEIGIAAGHTEAGIFLSFEEIIEQKLIRQEDSIQIAKSGDTDTPAPSPQATPAPLMSAGTEENKSSTIFQKKINLKNRKIAVVDLKAGADIATGFSDAIIMFAENAFVNIGTAIVVDRQNITQIIEEHQFQVNDLADASKAAQIGKLAGAEIIVIGNLNYVGKKYYLNIKLIDVTTAEILGSSIDTAEDDTGFFDMCNNAVAKLF